MIACFYKCLITRAFLDVIVIWRSGRSRLLPHVPGHSVHSWRDQAGISAEWGTPPVSFGAPPGDRMSIAASEGSLSLSGDDDSAALHPSGVVALSKPDPEMTAMLSHAAENVGLVWNPPPRPDSSRLDKWFLSGGRAATCMVSQRPPPVPFSRKCMRSLQDRGRHLSLPETNVGAPPPSPPSMVELLWGTRASPLWSRLCPTAATTLRG